MGELTEYRAGSTGAAAELVAWAEAARAAHALATSLVRTNVCPPAFRLKPEEATAVILYGAELGLSPVESLRSMFDIKGQIGVYVRTQVAIAQKHGHRIWTVRESDDSVTVAGQRADDPEHTETVTWTLRRAEQAGFIRRGRNGEQPSQYDLQPRAMLWARAAGEVVRRIAADALAGIAEGDGAPEPSHAPTGAPDASDGPIQRRPINAPTAELPAADTAPVAGGSTGQDEPEPDTRTADPTTGHETGYVAPSAPAPVEPPQTIDDPPSDASPGQAPLTGKQRARIIVSLNARGTHTHEERVAYLSEVLGHEVASTNDLTAHDASTVIDHLEWEAGQP